MMVFARDGYHCHYCDVKLWATDATVDHKMPASRGGSNETENLVACCRWCNNAKGDMPYALFVAIREEVGYGPGSKEIAGKVIALWHQRMRAVERPQWNAVLSGCG